MPYFNSLLEYWLLGTIFFYHKDVINIQLVHNLFTHSKTLGVLCVSPISMEQKCTLFFDTKSLFNILMYAFFKAIFCCEKEKNTER